MGRRKLDATKARAIRESSDPTRVLADRYGVSLTTIRQVRRGIKWKKAGGDVRPVSRVGVMWEPTEEDIALAVDVLSKRGAWVDAGNALGVSAQTVKSYASRSCPEMLEAVRAGEVSSTSTDRNLFLEAIEARRTSRSWAVACGAVGIPAGRLAYLRAKFPDLCEPADQAAMDGRNHHEMEVLARALDALDRHRTWLGVSRELGITSSALISYRQRHPEMSARLEQKYRAGKQARNELAAFVYVFRDGHGMVKVGVSKNPENRAKKLNNAGSSGVMDVLFTEHVGDAYLVESTAHASLSRYHHYGEWFRVDADVAISAVREAIANPTETRRKSYKRKPGRTYGRKPDAELDAATLDAIATLEASGEEVTPMKVRNVLASRGIERSRSAVARRMQRLAQSPTSVNTKSEH